MGAPEVVDVLEVEHKLLREGVGDGGVDVVGGGLGAAFAELVDELGDEGEKDLLDGGGEELGDVPVGLDLILERGGPTGISSCIPP